MTPEESVAEGLARLMEAKRGGKWSPLVRTQRDVAVAWSREARRSLTPPKDFHAPVDRPLPLGGGTAKENTVNA